MIYTYNKLVRDNIPNEINNKPGKKATFRVMKDDEYIRELNMKLIEEANEFIEENNIEELADVTEVIEAIMKVKNITWEQVRKAQEIKRNKRGAFENKIYLEYVDEKEKQ